MLHDKPAPVLSRGAWRIQGARCRPREVPYHHATPGGEID